MATNESKVGGSPVVVHTALHTEWQRCISHYKLGSEWKIHFQQCPKMNQALLYTVNRTKKTVYLNRVVLEGCAYPLDSLMLIAKDIHAWATNPSWRLQHVKKWWNTLAIRFGIEHYSLVWDRAHRRLGLTNYAKQTVSLSKVYVQNIQVTEAQVLDTLLHEIAHVLTPGCGHNKKWIQQAQKIGCNGKRCSDLDESLSIPKYILECGCRMYPRHRVRKKYLQMKCPHCQEIFIANTNTLQLLHSKAKSYKRKQSACL